jgi:hypothetical protein
LNKCNDNVKKLSLEYCKLNSYLIEKALEINIPLRTILRQMDKNCVEERKILELVYTDECCHSTNWYF